MSEEGTAVSGAPAEVATSLSRGTNWWGAFVIGLAGTILVTGIVPFAVSSMGAAAIPAIALVVVIGLIVCLCMGELAALLPHRTGGMPSYAYESFEPIGHTTAKHIGGVSGWGYWLGWFPVAPINMLLAAGYIAVLFHVPLGRTFSPLGTLGTPVSMGVLVITFVGLIGLFIPCYLGIKLGATFATVLGVTSMVPLTLLIILPIFKPSSFHWSNISGFHYASPATSGTIFFLAWIFVISWNAIAMEAAACYIGECRDPARDAKIALTAEGLYGVFVYIGTAIVFVGVLGASLKTADPLTLYTSFCDHIFGNAAWVKYVIGIPLIFALLLSVLNAIMGVARSLFQASEDRLLPRFFEHKNKHHVPDRAMAFNVVCALIVSLFGSPVRIYIFSNVGYLVAVCGVAVRVLPDPPDAAGTGQPVPHAGLVPLDRPGLRAVPHLRLLRGRLELARHRGRARAGALPLHPGPGDRGGLRAALLVAQDQRPAAGDRDHRTRCRWCSGRRVGSTSVTARSRWWCHRAPCRPCPPCRPRPSDDDGAGRGDAGARARSGASSGAASSTSNRRSRPRC